MSKKDKAPDRDVPRFTVEPKKGGSRVIEPKGKLKTEKSEEK